MIKIGFYLLGEKGYQCLLDFIDLIGVSSIAFVCSSRDLNTKKDFYNEINSVCNKYSIAFNDRTCSFDIVADYKVAIGWRWLIEESENLIVFHDSLLPKYRGFSPLVNALINGENEVGVTALKASHQYDAGPILGQVSMNVIYPIKIKDAISQISKLYSDLLIKISSDLIKGLPLNTYEQDALEVSFSPWRNEDDYLINWNDSSEKITRFVDATGYPYGGAKTKMSDGFIRVEEVKPIDDVVVEDRSSHVGKVLFMDEKYPIIICGSGLLKLISAFDENGASLVGRIPFRTKFGGSS